jgi:chromosome partitioning protein
VVKVVAIANAKGGVGKTTTAVNMAAGLAVLKKKTLFIDLDYQANGTFAFLNYVPQKTVANVLLDNIDIHEVIQKTGNEFLSILPSSLDLTSADTELSAQPGRDTALSVALRSLDTESWDYIIVDLPPNAGVMVLNGLTAADYVIIPVQTEFYAVKGVDIIIQLMELTKKRLNEKLCLLGALATMYDQRNNICKETVAYMHSFFGSAMFNTYIRTNIALAEAPAQNKNIFEYAPKSNGAEDYLAFCQEFLMREREMCQNG